MSDIPVISYNRFVKARTKRVAAAAASIGIKPYTAPTKEQLAHLAWHVAAIEPSELRLLNIPLIEYEPAKCFEAHPVVRDTFEELMPLPHPLDYEWRYDPRTRIMLSQRCEELAGSDGPIALLGTPTLAPALCTHAGGVLLVDSNAPVLTALAGAGQLNGVQWAHADLTLAEPPPLWRQHAQVVVCDPPWYPEGFSTFLRAAAKLVRPGGTILLSVPDPLTRPSAEKELDDVQDLAEQLQLVLDSVEVCALRYRTPFFEYRALRAAGVQMVPLDWRAGTLWQFSSHGNAFPLFGGGSASPASKPGIETTIGRVRFRILCTPPRRPGVLSVQPLLPGDTLPSVSRRHPARASANLWTSGNTVLNCVDPQVAASLLSAIAPGGEQLVDCQRLALAFARSRNLPVGAVYSAMDKINTVIAAERADFGAYQAAA
jgi:hypothetical protein